MNEEQLKSIDELEELLAYFKYHSTEDSSFVPEYLIALKIVKKVKSCELNDHDFEEIEDIYNEIVGQEHKNGSGWDDFHFRLGYFLWLFGYNAKWDSKTDRLKIRKLVGKD